MASGVRMTRDEGREGEEGEIEGEEVEGADEEEEAGDERLVGNNSFVDEMLPDACWLFVSLFLWCVRLTMLLLLVTDVTVVVTVGMITLGDVTRT